MRGKEVTGVSFWDRYGIHSPCTADCKDRRYDCHLEGHCEKWDEYKRKREEFMKSDKYKKELARSEVMSDWRFRKSV